MDHILWNFFLSKTWALSSSRSTSRSQKLSDQERPDSDYAKESSVRLDNCSLNDMMLGFKYKLAR